MLLFLQVTILKQGENHGKTSTKLIAFPVGAG
jgi:hypothetical protein